MLQKKRSDDNLHPQNNSVADNIFGDLHQQSIRCLIVPSYMNTHVHFVVLHVPQSHYIRGMIISGMNLPFSITYHDLLQLQKELVLYFVKRVITVCDIICLSFVRNSVEKGLQTTDLYLAKVNFFFFFFKTSV